MKKFITLLIAASFCLCFAQELRRTAYDGSKFQQYGLFETDGAGTADSIHLDSAEADTSSDYWDMAQFAYFADDNIMGTFAATCRDSAGGSDSLDVTFKMLGNWTDGALTSVWKELATMTISADDGAATTTVDTLKSHLAPRYVRYAVLQTGQEAAEKPTCYNMSWTIRRQGRLVE